MLTNIPNVPRDVRDVCKVYRDVIRCVMTSTDLYSKVYRDVIRSTDPYNPNVPNVPCRAHNVPQGLQGC